MLRCKNDKKMGVRIAYRSETIEKEVKIGRVRPLLSVSRMRVKARICRQDPAFTWPKTHQNKRSKRNLKMRKSLKNLQIQP